MAIDDARGLEYSGYQQYLKTRAGGEVTLTVKREGDMLLQIAVPVSDEGKLGVMDYYEMKNTIADTAMRDSIASMGEGANAPRKK